MERAKVFPLQQEEGFPAVALQLRRSIIDISPFKVIFAYIGRAQVEWQRPAQLADSVLEFVATARRFNTKAIIVIAGPIPRGSDGRQLIARCVNAGKKIRATCRGLESVVFSSVAQDFYSIHGLNKFLINHKGVSKLGRSTIIKDIHAKLACYM